MANEFIIRKGFISKADSVLTGSLLVSQNITGASFIKDGSTSDDILLGDGTTTSLLTVTALPTGTVSGSIQILGGSTILSGSKTDISNLNTFTSSIQTEVDGISSVTSSYLTDLPAGTVSGSTQITDGSTLLSGSKTDISNLNTFTSSIQAEVDTISATTASYLTDLPSGTISGSIQILGGSTILSGSKTDITNLNSFTSSIQTEVDGISSVTSSYLTDLPTGTISGSTQITNGSTILSGSKTDISDLNTFTSSIQSEVDTISATTASYLTDLPSGTVSGSEQLPAGLVSGSIQITNGSTILSGSKTDITNLNTFTSSIQTEVDGLSSVTSSYLTDLPSGTVSGSTQITDGSTLLSGSKTDITNLNTFTSSIQTEVDTISSVTSSYLTDLPSGTVSGSTQITDASTILSGSKTDISNLNSFTSSIQTEVDGISNATSSYLLNTTDTLDGDLTVTGIVTAQEFHTEFISSSIVYESGSTKFGDTADDEHQFTGSLSVQGTISADQIDGMISGSSQIEYVDVSNIPAGIVSGSTQITNASTLLSGSKTDISNLNTFTSSIQSEVDTISATTASYLTDLPSGTISGSIQILGGSNIVSGSSQLTTDFDTRYVDLTSNQATIAGEKTFTSAITKFTNRVAIDTEGYGGSRLGDSNFQTPQIDTTAISFKTASQVTVAAMFLNPEGDTFTIKGFDDSVMVTNLTSIAAISGSEPAESTIANTIELTNGNIYINDQGVQIYPAATTPVAETFFQILQNKGGAPRMGFYSAYYDGSTYDRIYSISPAGSFEFENDLLVTGSINVVGDVTASAFTVGGTGENLLLDDGTLVASSSLGGSSTTYWNTFMDESGGTLVGALNDSNTSFTVNEGTYVSGTLSVFQNGQLINSSIDQSSAASGIFVIDEAPSSTDELVVTYQIGVISTYEDQLISSSQQLDGSTLTDMTISGSFSGSYIGDGSQLTGVGSDLPAGVVSGSTQITDASTILSGSKTDISNLNTFTSSIQTEVDGISNVTSSYLTTIPIGTISGSSQLIGSTLTDMTISGSFSGSYQGDGSQLTGITAGGTSATGTGTAFSITNTSGIYYNMASANSGTTYTTTGTTTGAWAQGLINASSEPSVTSATKQAGSLFVADTDMQIVVYHNGNEMLYYFVGGPANAVNYLEPTASNATAINMGYSGGHYLYMSAPTTATTFTTTNPRLGGWAKVRISGSATPPTVTGATFISGAVWNSSISGSEQYLGIEYNGNITEYFYLDI